MLIAARLWSDFGAHIPLIRSFSLGSNWPPQYPVFPGEPIRYHFLFYLFVGLLERIGVRIDWALNIPSIIGFFGIIILLFLISKELFSSRKVAYLAIIFFLLNGSLSFIQFFEKHPLSINTPLEIVRAGEFPAFAPWDQREILAFWNLNIYTNQRHLAAAFSLCLFFLYMLLRMERGKIKHTYRVAAALGLLVGIFPFFHQPSLIIIAAIMGVYVLLYSKLRIPLILLGIVAAVVTIPQFLLLPKATEGISWHPGFYVHDRLTVFNFILYWWKNMGVHLLLIPIGFLFIPMRAKKALLPAFLLFTISNMFQFSKELAASHKFFNFAFILGQMASAYVLVWYLNLMRRKYVFLRVLSVIHVGILVWFLTFSGIIDLFVIANDRRLELTDIPANKTAVWFLKNTRPDTVILNSRYLYHPASLAGRNIFLGWPYFAWSAGYEENRMPIMDTMYESRDPNVYCPLMDTYNISYITVEDTINDENLPEIRIDEFLKRFTPVYLEENKKYAIFTRNEMCTGYTASQ